MKFPNRRCILPLSLESRLHAKLKIILAHNACPRLSMKVITECDPTLAGRPVKAAQGKTLLLSSNCEQYSYIMRLIACCAAHVHARDMLPISEKIKSHSRAQFANRSSAIQTGPTCRGRGNWLRIWLWSPGVGRRPCSVCICRAEWSGHLYRLRSTMIGYRW